MYDSNMQLKNFYQETFIEVWPSFTSRNIQPNKTSEEKMDYGSESSLEPEVRKDINDGQIVGNLLISRISWSIGAWTPKCYSTMGTSAEANPNYMLSRRSINNRLLPVLMVE